MKMLGTIFVVVVVVSSIGGGDINVGGVLNRAWGGFVGMINGINNTDQQQPQININIPQSPNDRPASRGYNP